MSFNFKELEQDSYRNGSLLASMTIDFGVHCSVDSPVYNHQVACAFQFQQSNSQTHQRRKIQQESHLPQGFPFSTCNSLLSSWKRSFLRDGLSDWKGIPVRGSCDGRGLQWTDVLHLLRSCSSSRIHDLRTQGRKHGIAWHWKTLWEAWWICSICW